MPQIKNDNDNTEIKKSTSKPVDVETEITVLKELYTNADTGKASIDNIMKKTDDGTLKNLLLSHYESYNDMAGKIASKLNKNGETPKPNNAFGKAMIWSSINFNTLFDRSPSHIANMMIQGSNMGIIDINKSLNEHSNSLSKDTLSLAWDLLALEQQNIDDLKPYL